MKRCRACGHQSLDRYRDLILAHKRFWALESVEPHDVVRCTQCGFKLERDHLERRMRSFSTFEGREKGVFYGKGNWSRRTVAKN